MKARRPLIVLIDIDGTLIGDISPQVCEWVVIQRFDKKKIPQFKVNLKRYLQNGLLRPDFSLFVDIMKNRYNCEFFVYTASETKWANFLVPCIEQIIDFKFNRPIFTRKHCFVMNKEYKKSTEKLLPQIFRTLKERYEITTHDDLKSHIMMVDNTSVLLKHEMSRLILCPTYSFIEWSDPTKLIDEQTLYDHYSEMAVLMAYYNIFPSVQSQQTLTLNQFKMMLFTSLSSNIKSTIKRQSSSKDTFWSTLGHIVSKNDFDNFKDPVIKYINEKIQTKST